jgi:hypothetical protein
MLVEQGTARNPVDSAPLPNRLNPGLLRLVAIVRDTTG